MLTASEVRYFQSFATAVVDASVISVNKMIRIYNYLRPYGEQVKIIAMHVAAFTIAFCHLSYRWLQPRIMQMIDTIVESGGSKCSESDTESQTQNTEDQLCDTKSSTAQSEADTAPAPDGMSASQMGTSKAPLTATVSLSGASQPSTMTPSATKKRGRKSTQSLSVSECSQS